MRPDPVDHPDLIVNRDPVADQGDKGKSGRLAFQNGVRCEGTRNKHDRCVRFYGLHRFGDRVEDRPAQVLGAAFAGRDTGHHLCAVLYHLARMEAAFFSSHAAHDHSRVPINQDCHVTYRTAPPMDLDFSFSGRLSGSRPGITCYTKGRGCKASV